MRPNPFGALVSLALAALTLMACGSSTPQAEQPEPSGDSSEKAEKATSTSDSPSGGEEGGAAAPSDTARSAPRDDSNVIPDDYTMSNGDCSALGLKLTSVVRAEYMAQMSPKLSEEKRSAKEQEIDEVASKIGTNWTNVCARSLVDKVVDRKSLKCALESRSSKGFEECINPPLEPKK
jgi:hypothetical protein